MRYLRLMLLLLVFGFNSAAVLADLPASPRPGVAWIRCTSPILTPTQLQALHNFANARIERQLLDSSQCVAYGHESQALKVSSDNANAPQQSRLAQCEYDLLRTFVVNFDAQVNAAVFCADLTKKLAFVEYAAPVFRNQLQYTPNDEHVADQTYLTTIHAFEAWDKTRGDSSIIVAVSDAGTRISHEDLRNAIAVNKAEIPNNGIDDDHNGYVDDYNGYNFAFNEDKSARDAVFNPNQNHGTCVAGIIGATQNNSIGVSGIGGKCKLIAMKTASNDDSQYLDYGYESIVYAAIRGASIVNCSWGNSVQGYNPLEQSVIDYATSKGCCVVVAAGNYQSRPTDPFYPATYNNVLSVCETDVNGALTSTSSYGAHGTICAPGDNAVTTDNDSDNEYSYSVRFGGTSSACPMVSGALALVRSVYPTLSPLQAMQHLRVSGTPLADKNPTLAQFVPRMVDAQKAVNSNPFSSASLRIQSMNLTATNGTTVNHAAVGDTLAVSFILHNYLGKATDLHFRLSAVDPAGVNAVVVKDTVISVDACDRDANITVSGFSLIVMQRNTLRMFLRLDVSGTNEDASKYEDFELREFYATPDFITLHNDVIRFSLGDYGWIGSNQPTDGQRKGDGFCYLKYGNLLYRGGLICTSTESRIRSGIGSDGSANNDFRVLSYSNPWPYELRLDDLLSPSDTRIGAEIEERWTISDKSLAVCDVKVTNRSGDSWSEFAIGLCLDWDLSSLGDSCYVKAVKGSELSNPNSVAEFISRNSTDAVVGCMVVAKNSGVNFQAAGLNAAFISANFPASKQYEALHSGTSIQSAGPDDMSMVVGLQYPESTPNAAIRQLRFILGAAPSADSLKKLFSEPTLSSAPDFSEADNSTLVFPQPASSFIKIQFANAGVGSVRLSTVDGRVVREISNELNSQAVTLPVQDLANGMYIVEWQLGTARHAAPIVILH